MFRRKRPSQSSRLRAPAAHAVEALEGRVLLSTYMVTNMSDSGLGSLRDDIVMSNAAGGANTITFAPGLSGTITLTSGQLEISSNLTITGPGAGSLTISGDNKSRVFQVDVGVTASISEMELYAGLETRGDGGAILNNASLSVSQCAVVGNEIYGPGGGGAIYSSGPLLTVTDSTISNNYIAPVPIGSNGNGGDGGGIDGTSGTIIIQRSTINNNRAGDGPQIRTSATDGLAGRGGAVYSDGDLVLVNDTIVGNRSGTGGGRSYMPPISPAAGGDGGGVFSAGPLRVTNCTIVGNMAGLPGDGSVVHGNGGGLFVASAAAVVQNTILAANLDGGDLDGRSLDLSSANNLMGGDPVLAELGAYGGPTETMPPLVGSPAIDAGSNALAIGPDGTPLTTDQRGMPRIVDATHNGTPTVDIGAVEAAPIPVFPLVVTTTVDSDDTTFDPANLSLRDGVKLANALYGPHTITFAPGLSGIIALGGATPSLALNRPFSSSVLIIKGPGSDLLRVLSSNPAYPSTPFYCQGGSAEVDNLGIAGATNNSQSGTFTLVNDLIDGNVRGDGAIHNGGNMLLIDCNVSGNSATGSGGGIDNGGTLTIINSTISGNTAGLGGGGIYNELGTVTMFNSTVSGNQAKGDGGGVDNWAYLTMVNCTVSDNTSTNGTGGGISSGVGIQGMGAASLYNTIVAGNHNLMRPDIAGNLDSNYETGKTQYTRSLPSSNNLIADGSGGLPRGSNGNLLGTPVTPLDPLLSPLGNYGGPTQTMPPQAGSPAIDSGSNALATGTDGSPLTTDQRGLPRIFNGIVDIGAVETRYLPGDADLDGKVDFADVLIVARNYGKGRATWADGDFNNDGSVGFDDLLIVARNYGKSIALTTTTAAVNAAKSLNAVAAQPVYAWHKLAHKARTLLTLNGR